MRLFEMFMGPLEATKPWATSGVEGVKRFLDRAWRLFVNEDSGEWLLDETEATPAQLTLLHKTIKKVGEDIEGMRFNTAISAMMEFVNAMTKESARLKTVLEPFIQLIAPFAPHLGEELWSRSNGDSELSYTDYRRLMSNTSGNRPRHMPFRSTVRFAVKLTCLLMSRKTRH